MSKLGDVGHRLYTGEVQYDFVGRKRTWYAISAAIILISIGALIFRGLNFGIEFKGGGDFRVASSNCSVEQVRQAVVPFTEAEPIVQSARGVGGAQTLRVQTEVLDRGASQEIAGALAKTCQVEQSTIQTQVIGAVWGGEVSQKALIALVVFLVLVSVFIRILFETKMAVAAIVALLHDLVITIGIYALIGFEVTPATVIGMLTILGYSLYDTIVVFDSLRENTRALGRTNKMTYSEAANLSVNQTLVRSINTSVIALLPIGAILVVGSYLLGAGTLKDLSLVLFIGIAASTFSSIFFATPILAQLKEREPEMQELTKKVHAARAKQARSSQAQAPDAAADAGSGGGTATAVLERGPDEPPTAGPSAGSSAIRSATSGRPAHRPASRPATRKGATSKKKRGR